jgi:hypothetical protein
MERSDGRLGQREIVCREGQCLACFRIAKMDAAQVFWIIAAGDNRSRAML